MSKALAVFSDLKICSMICFFLLFTCIQYRGVMGGFRNVRDGDWKYMYKIVDAARDVIKSTYNLIDSVEYIKQNHLNKAPYEIGYVMFTLVEKYRKMVDKYNSSITMGRKHYTMELLIYLEEIEQHYWEVEHLSNMLHEIERKYNISTKLQSKYRELTSAEVNVILAKQKADHRNAMSLTTEKLKIKKDVLDRLIPTRPRKKYNFFPKDYGW